MKNNILLTIFSSIFCWIVFTNSLPEPKNPETGNTGAPGETTCMLSSCHAGGTFTGDVEISGVPDTVIANQTYDVTLITKSNALRSGFQLTVLDAINKFTGTLTAGTGSNISKNNGNGRTYIRQSSAVNFANGQVSWTFKWKAPATVLNDSLIFYFVGMLANGDGNKTLDNTVKNRKRVFFQLAVDNENIERNSSTFNCSFQNGVLTIHDFDITSIQQIDLIQLNGNTLYTENNIAKNQIPITNITPGIYIARILSNNQSYARVLFAN
ncbi:MAG: hypothetical protein IPO78_04755 [Saprospiraceae bacterium]|nr:hypothetical protein [Saprospiraceae bacterium]MBK8449163.1 hypothetical protein [Saprospiraceae bacterium]MBK8484785.1 hypothetical protein [Saprospiraceae bacterium]MBK9222178.1 hypothetical protein [Saprospiraceae bacterium]MBK9720912.1 hypothetical protein [Saprospiraceae bacterium]